MGAVGWGLGVVFWFWVLFLGGAEQIDGTWLAAWLVPPGRESVEAIVILKVVAAIYLVLSAAIPLIFAIR